MTVNIIIVDGDSKKNWDDFTREEQENISRKLAIRAMKEVGYIPKKKNAFLSYKPIGRSNADML